MKDVIVFNNELFGQVRIAKDRNGEPLFCLPDVCRTLELRASDVKRRLDDGVVSTHTVTDSLGRRNQLNFVNEDGLYDVILDSRKAEARVFRKWVTSEVLPQIRKTGGYVPVRKEDSPEELMARALLVAQKTIEQKDALIEARNRQLEEQRPKVMFADAVASCDDSILMRDLAKLLCQNGVEVGQNRLFCWMRENGFIFKNDTRPMQKWVDRGLFSTTVTIVETNHGSRERLTTKVTGTGQRYFIDGFLNGRFAV